MSAELWSAVAASFAALCSFLIWRIQTTNLQQMFRPEIAIGGWSRESTGEPVDVIRFATLTNIGNGAARQIHLSGVGKADDDRLSYMISSVSITVLGDGESVDIDAQIRVYWKSRAKLGKHKDDRNSVTPFLLGCHRYASYNAL